MPAIEIQTIGPISMRFGIVEDHDLGIVFMYFGKNPALADLLRPKIHFWPNCALLRKFLFSKVVVDS